MSTFPSCLDKDVPLRPYQEEVITAVGQAVDLGKRCLIVVAPTGSGKTVIAAKIIADAVQGAGQVLFLVHRRELVKQSSVKLHALGVDHGIIAAGFPRLPSASVQIASIQTLHARGVRSSRMELPAADLVLVDEAHHATARTWSTLLASYGASVIIGMTATPCRADGRGLGGIFETLIECPQIPQLIEAGFLVPTKVFAPYTPDLVGVRIKAGDYAENQLAERMDVPKLVGDIVTHWHRLADRRRTVVFAVNVEHSIHLRNEFQHSGAVAEHLDGSTPAAERDAIDSPDTKLVDEVEQIHGPSPLHVLTPSGGRHLYYRHAGERRRIRPLPDLDVLGTGNVVCAGSETPTGRYVIERGSLNDLDHLPPLAASPGPSTRPQKVPIGKRNDELFRHLHSIVAYCDTLDQLIDAARTWADDRLAAPLDDTEVVKTCESVWTYREGRKRFMHTMFAGPTYRKLIADPHAMALAFYLACENGPSAEFWIANGLGRDLGWPYRLVPHARKVLLDLGIIRCVRRPRKGANGLYKWSPPRDE